MNLHEEINAKWHPLGDRYFQKIHLYDMPWMADHVNLVNFKIASGQYGGHIALYLDSMTTESGQVSKPLLQLFTSSGKPVSQQLWKDASVVSLGWSYSENLFLVQTTGKVGVIDLMGQYKRTFSMGQEAEEQGVIEARFYQTDQGIGLAVLTGRNKIFCISCVDEPRIRRLPEIPGLTRTPTSWIAFSTQVLVARDNQLFFLDTGGKPPLEAHPPIQSAANAILSMAVSCNQKLVALFLDTGVLWVGDAELTKCHLEYDTERVGSRPIQMVWVGIVGVLIYWQGSLLLVGAHGDIWEYPYHTHVYLEPEVDGVRIITADRHEFLQCVPRELEEIGRIGDSGGARLHLAYRELISGSTLADDYLCSLEGDAMLAAVDQCMLAAGQAYEPDLQKRMLEAARLGRGFLVEAQYLKSDTFSEVCRNLAVLNNIRHSMIGLPLTYKQLLRLSIPSLIDRLIARGHYPMAQQVCSHLRLPEAQAGNRVLGHWACRVVETAKNERTAADKIVSRLGTRPGLSYAKIASRAHECGKQTLAELLLEQECRASEQIPLLLKLKLYPRALAAAVDSGDPELIQFVVEDVRTALPSSEVLLLLRSQSTAAALYTTRMGEEESGGLLAGQMAEQEDDRALQASKALSQAFKEENFERRVGELEKSVRFYKQCQNEFMSMEVDNCIRLLRYQKRLEEEFTHPFIGLSLNQTLYQLILRQNNKLVDRMKSEFRVPDKRFWYVKLEALAERGDWTEIDKMSKEKRRPPVGFEAFVDVCLKHDNKGEGAKYIPKLEPEPKVRYLYKLDRIDEAIDTAYTLKSEEGLSYLHQHLVKVNRTAADRVATMLNQLK